MLTSFLATLAIYALIFIGSQLLYLNEKMSK